MDKFMNFIKSNNAKGVRSFSIIIFLQQFFIVPIISKMKLDWLILITVPMGFFINLGFIVFTIKQYINYNNQINS